MSEFKFTEYGMCGRNLVQKMEGNGKTYFRICQTFTKDGQTLPTSKGVSVERSDAKALMNFLAKFIEETSSGDTNEVSVDAEQIAKEGEPVLVKGEDVNLDSEI